MAKSKKAKLPPLPRGGLNRSADKLVAFFKELSPWLVKSDLRFGQFYLNAIANVQQNRPWFDPYYVENEELLHILKAYKEQCDAFDNR